MGCPRRAAGATSAVAVGRGLRDAQTPSTTGPSRARRPARRARRPQTNASQDRAPGCAASPWSRRYKPAARWVELGATPLVNGLRSSERSALPASFGREPAPLRQGGRLSAPSSLRRRSAQATYSLVTLSTTTAPAPRTSLFNPRRAPLSKVISIVTELCLHGVTHRVTISVTRSWTNSPNSLSGIGCGDGDARLT